MKKIVNAIMDVMEKIEYGFKDSLGNNIIVVDRNKWDNDFGSFYYLQSPEELESSKCGVCWDQVELERKLFEDNNISVRTYFIYFLDGDSLPSHTFLTFQDEGNFYWFEHSWEKYKGIYEYSSEEELLNDVINKFKMYHKEVRKDAVLYLYEYNKPKYHISCDEFYKYIESTKQILIKK